MGGKGHLDEVSGRNKECVIGNRRKVCPCYKVVKNLAELCSCSCVWWKVERKSDETGSLDEKISKPCVEGAAWLLLIAYNKI